MIKNRGIAAIENRYKIECIGTGASMPGGPIRFITLSFQVRGALSKQNLRRMLVTSAQDILKIANEIPDLDSCLHNPPFGIKSLDILLFVYDVNGRDTYDPDISSARLSDGIVEFITDAPNCYLKVQNQYTETYEEALKAIEEEDGLK
ncbi:MAG: hypothetical protein Q8K75_04390 [Chlamydiales bacterium]|nr:hypothetical protein [Chlamydiales bacterium]